MKKKSRYFAFILAFTAHSLFSQETNIVPGNIIVMLNSAADTARLSNELNYISEAKTNFKVARTLSKSMQLYLFEFDETAINASTLLNMVKLNPIVKTAQFNHIAEERNTPNDVEFTQQWNMNNTGQNSGTVGADISAIKAWDIATGGLTASGDTIVVAVIDRGFDITHQDITFWKNYNEIPNNKIDDDNNGYVDDYNGWNTTTHNDTLAVQTHGTHLCGIIGAKGNNGIGVSGINWNVKVMPVSVNSTIESEILAGYAYVLEQRKQYNLTNGAKGAFIVSSNSSFGLNLAQPAAHPIWCAMYDTLGSVGILNAGATANANINVDTQGDMPSACISNWLITVTNTTNTDAKAVAGFGATTIDLGAPGTGITSTGLSNGYTTLSGTSVATPHVTGTIALMYAVACSQLMIDCKNDPKAFALMIKDSILGAVDPIAALNGKTVTGGRLNLYKSLRSVKNHYFKDTCPSVPININEYAQTNNFFEIKNVYPNPTDKDLNIVYTSNGNTEIRITNVLGQEVKRISAYTNSNTIQEKTIDVSNLIKGIYFLSMYADTTKLNAVKLVVY
jgi:serine protease